MFILLLFSVRKKKKTSKIAAAETASFFGASEASAKKDRVEDGKIFRKIQNCVAPNFWTRDKSICRQLL
jgi:hypothetical protein